MSYISEINSFWDLTSTNPLSTGQVALWFALMHINNRCNWTEWFQVSNQVLSVLTGMSRSGILKARNELKQRGLIDFKERGTKATSYKMFTIANSTQVSVQVSTQDGVQDGVQVSTQDGVQKSNTLNRHRQRLRQDKKDTDVSKKVSVTDPEKVKHKYGEYKHVTLTDGEHLRLIADFGEPLVLDAIRYLDEYAEMKGYKHNSSNLAIRKWVIDAVKRDRGKQHGTATGNDTTDTGGAYNADEYYGDAGTGFAGF
jgi:hypothetical protein